MQPVTMHDRTVAILVQVLSTSFWASELWLKCCRKMSASSDVQETGTAQEPQPSVVMRRLRINGASVDGRDFWRPYLFGRQYRVTTHKRRWSM